MKLNKILLTSTVIVPALGPSLTLTSCNQTWGYLNPISFGSMEKGSDNDPYMLFRDETTDLPYYDPNGLDIVQYLQSNYIIDQSKSTYYAYTSPVTKWYETKEEAEGEEPMVLPTGDWKRLDDGWKTTSDKITTSVTLDDPVDDRKNIKKSYTNNENFNLISSINFSSMIASTLANYLVSALQYQGGQINKNSNDDLNAAWGSESSLMPDGWAIETGSRHEQSCRNFYEYIFASSNSHSSGKANAFLRPVSVNFNFNEQYFPFPSYEVSGATTKGNIDLRVDISDKTKALLMGPDHPDKFCVAGTKESGTLAYHTAKPRSRPVIIPYEDNDGVWHDYEIDVQQYLFGNVPIVVELKNMSAQWVNPTKNNSFVPSDYFVNDGEQVKKAIGNSWDKISDFTDGDKTTTIKKFNFNLDGVNNHRQVKIESTERDPRLNEYINGNSFIVLVSYVVNEYNSDETIAQLKKDFEEKGLERPAPLTDDALKKLNVASINSIDSIFPAFILGLPNDELFKTAQKNTDEMSYGYIIDSTVVNKYNSALLGLIKKTSSQGMKPHASQLDQSSKDLLAFLAYMFSSEDGSLNTNDVLQIEKWPEQ